MWWFQVLGRFSAHIALANNSLDQFHCALYLGQIKTVCLFYTSLFCTSSSSVVLALRGRFSVINLCRDVETSQVFAAKITPYQAEQRQLVLREYQLLKRIHHPHLVQLHTAFITSCYMVLVEELCPGKELLDSLAAR